MSDKRQATSDKQYKRLRIWQDANDFVIGVYKETANFPVEEKFGITSQLRRAALSVVLNIVEGQARRNDGDFARFVDISLGSLAEVEYLLELCLELVYFDQKQYERLEEIRDRLGKSLFAFRVKLRKKT